MLLVPFDKILRGVNYINVYLPVEYMIEHSFILLQLKG